MEKNTIKICNLFEKWLKENNIFSEYRCTRCGHTQGHHIIWCPKCGDKMIHGKNVPYWDCVKYGDIKDSTYFKGVIESLIDSKINWDFYNRICDILENKAKTVN